MVLIASVSKGSTIFQIISAVGGSAPHSGNCLGLELEESERNVGDVGELHLRPSGRRAVSLKTQPHAIRS